MELKPAMDHYNVTVDWTTLDGYYQRLQRQGTPLNIGTYVGAAQVREAVLGDVDRKPNPEELELMIPRECRLLIFCHLVCLRNTHRYK